MDWKIQILLIVTAGVSSFSTYNSTPVIDNEQLFKPIIIPNITKYFEQPQTAKTRGRVEEKDSDQQHRALHLQKPPQEPTTLAGNYSDEEFKVSENSLKFSSRYSTKEKDRGKTGQTNGSATEVPRSGEGNDNVPGSGESQGIEKRLSFSDRSDELDSSEEEKEDVRNYFDTNEPEESEVAPTTNEPSEDLPRSTSFQSSSYPDEDFNNYEIPSTVPEEEEKRDSEEAEEKRSVDDYYNSGSKNYHSVQTPLSKIQYRGPHSFREDFSSEKIRTRLVSPIRHHSIGHKWPYARSQTKAELEDANEISESDESSLDQGIRKELEGKPRIVGLELAVEKDEKRVDEKRKYNFVKERERGKLKVKSLAAEEEKDHRRFPFHQTQYQVDEEPRYQPSKQTLPNLGANEGPRSSKSPLTTTPRNIFKEKPKESTKLNFSRELAPDFEAHQFLGPVVFKPNGDEEKGKAAAKAKNAKNINKGPTRKAFAKDLMDREKLDQDNLINERIQKSIFGTGSADYASLSFNHLEESEEMYNAILANIQSVFGLRTQTPKSSDGGSRSSGPGTGESRSLTWSLPMPKRSQVV